MIINIDDKQSIRTLQKEFSDAYPYLKIEFFSKPHRPGAGSEKRLMKDVTTTIGKSRLQHNPGKLVIDGDMTVSEVEKMFEENYGLYVQVFRRSGKLWLETTVTDSWTINYQNEQGKELSESGIGNKPEDIDYHEQE